MNRASITTFILATACTGAHAYELNTHEDIGAAAAKRSALTTDGLLMDRLGLRPAPAGAERRFVSPSTGKAALAWELVSKGARGEDEPKTRVCNHFYNPLDGNGLLGFFNPSIDWALEDGAEPFNICLPSSQAYSYKDAREAQFGALTARSESERVRQFGRVFETLGHVTHVIADLAQPQHVRNDPHLNLGLASWQEAPLCAAFPQYCLDYLSLKNPSKYEKYTEDTDRRKAIFESAALLDSYPVDWVYPGRPSSGRNIRSPRDFWKSTAKPGAGLAEYTNAGFVSAGTNFSGTPDRILPAPSLPLPNGDGAQVRTWQITDPAMLGAEAQSAGLSGQLQMIGTPVNDVTKGEPDWNDRTSSYGIFDEDLTRKGFNKTFTLNRLTMDAAQRFLLPRAVAYSAALIDYFFRGRLEIGLPDEGVYGVIDHNDPARAAAGTGGFDRIKLRIRNVTPGDLDGSGNRTVEAMGEGPVAIARLWAAVKFHRNTCYRPDLSGEFGAPGITREACYLDVEELTLSDPVPVPPGINASPQLASFNFPVPIPINATDLFLQVIYRGPLGQEPDAVVVATKDISEPTYHHAYSRWDQYTYGCPWPEVSSTGCGATYTYAQWCATGGYETQAECDSAMGLTFLLAFSPTAAPVPGYDPANNPPSPPGSWSSTANQRSFAPVAVMPAPVGGLSRIAVLTDAPAANAELYVADWIDPRHGASIFNWGTGTTWGAVNQLDPRTGQFAASETWLPARGAWVPARDAALLNDGPVHPPLRLLNSAIVFPDESGGGL